MTEIAELQGRALVQHMIDAHGFVTWCPPEPNTIEYRRWKRTHETDYHGSWTSQQNHFHTQARRRARA